jgi:uncharacterized membrane protein
MPTTAWGFPSTEAADDAVLRLKQLDAQELINVHDCTVLRWPHYSSRPITDEHVTDEGSAVSALTRKLKSDRIANSMIDAVKGDMRPGTSALVLMSTEGSIDAVTSAFEGKHMELIRSDLSVQEQDLLRRAIGESGQAGPPG